MRRARIVLAILLVCLMFACRKRTLPADAPTEQALELTQPMLQVQEPSELRYIGKISMAEGGLYMGRLVLSLDHPKEGAEHRLGDCLNPIEDNELVIGEIVCENDELKAPLKLKYLFQQCFAFPERGKVDQLEPLVIKNCAQAEVFLKTLSPDLRLELQ